MDPRSPSHPDSPGVIGLETMAHMLTQGFGSQQVLNTSVRVTNTDSSKLIHSWMYSVFFLYEILGIS